MKRPSRFSLLLLAAALVAGVSCTNDQGATGPQASPPLDSLRPDGLLGIRLEGLVSCSPLPYDSTTETIGPDGGMITVGPHRLTIPAGALSQDVEITAIAPSDSVNSVRLFPEGLTFADSAPAQLTLSYANCSLLGRLLPKRIAYTTDLLDLLDLLPSFDDLWRQRVSASLEHFSRYAVSW